MRIPRSYVEAYSRSLNAISDRARRELESRLSEIDWSLGVAEVRGRVAAIMEMCCGASATMAARLAADFYDGLRAEFGIEDGYRAEVNPRRDPEATEGAVRAFVQDIVDGKPVEAFVSKCSDRVDREARLAANRCVEHNARRDPKKPRWARVPTGPETCEFCIMLASRGFKYHGKEVASHAHANCDCRVIPSWDKTEAEVEGYDPDYYLDCYKHREEHPEIREAINARRRELRAQRRAALTREERIAEYAAIETDLSKRINEARGGNAKRDAFLWSSRMDNLAQSLTTGRGSISIQYKADFKAHELMLAKRFADEGHDVELLYASGEPATHTPDFRIDGVLMEAKRLEASTVDRLGKKIHEASAQSRDVIIDLQLETVSRDDAVAKANELLRKPMRRYLNKYERTHGYSAGEPELRVDSVTLVFHDHIETITRDD